MPRRSLCFGFLAASLVLTGSGCGGGAGPNPVKVTVKVKLDGSPLASAGVAFIPEDGQGRPANGFTGSDGEAHLTTDTPGDGIVPGTYKIVVTKEDVKQDRKIGAVKPEDAIKQNYGKFVEEMTKNKGAVKPPKELSPKVYTSAATTPYKNIKMPPPSGTIDLELRKSGGT